MGRFQTFDWVINKDEAFYFYRVINIANRLGSRFAVAKTANDDDTRLKLAVEYDNLATLETFKERVCNRMTFENWQHLSDRHFLYESWLFVPDQHDSLKYSEVGQLLQNVANYPHGFPQFPDAVLFPYNMVVYRNEIGSLEELDDLQQLVTQARIPNISELKSGIQALLSNDDSVTYFEYGNYWDAKIVIGDRTMYLEVITSDDNDYVLFGLRGDWDVCVSVSQQLANEFGSMVIDAIASDWR